MLYDDNKLDLQDFDDDFSDLLAEIENFETLPILLNDNSQKLKVRNEELKHLKNELDQIKLQESEMEQSVNMLSLTLEKKLLQEEALTASIDELKTRIKKLKEGKQDSKSKFSSEDLEAIETEKKTLNMYKRLLKLKWLLPSKLNGELEALIFNDRNAYVKYATFTKSDPSTSEKIWKEITTACENDETNWIENFSA